MSLMLGCACGAGFCSSFWLELVFLLMIDGSCSIDEE